MNDWSIYANILVYNELPDIQRCLDSLSGVTDKIFVVDSFSTDGTWEWLNKVKNIYQLELFQNKFDSFLQQRTFLLEKTPKPCWLITIDADESLTANGSILLREAIKAISKEEVEQHTDKAVVTLEVPYIQLKDSLRNRIDSITRAGQKFFFCDENIRFKNKSHCFPHLKSKEDKDVSYAKYDVSLPIAVKHHAFLDKRKMEARKDRIKNDPTVGQYEYDFYYATKHNVVPLEKELW